MTSFESNHGTNVDSKLIKRELLRKTKIKDIENNIDVEACCLLDKKILMLLSKMMSLYPVMGHGQVYLQQNLSIQLILTIQSLVMSLRKMLLKGEIDHHYGRSVYYCDYCSRCSDTNVGREEKNGKILKASEPKQEAQLKVDKLNPKEVKATEMAVDWIENIDQFKLESED